GVAFAPGATAAGAGALELGGTGTGSALIASLLPANEPGRVGRPAGPLPALLAAAPRGGTLAVALGGAGNRLGPRLHRGEGPGRRAVPVAAGGAGPGQRAAAAVAAAGPGERSGGAAGVGVAAGGARAAAGPEKR